jgi:hypothetical protein
VLKLNVILQNFAAFLVSNSIPLVILLLAYWIIPAKLTLYLMGGLALITAIVTFILFAIFAYLGIKGLQLKVEPAPDTLDTYPQAVQEMIDFLKQRDFTHFGDMVNDKMMGSARARSLIFLNPSKHIAAEISNIDHSDVSEIEFFTLWSNGNFVSTGANSGFNIQKPHYAFLALDNDPLIRYQRHVHYVKEMQAVSGTPMKIENLQQVADFSPYSMRIAGADVNFAVVVPVIVSNIGAVVPLMALAALFVEGGALFGVLPESENLNPLSPYILFGIMSFLVFITPKLTKKRINTGWDMEVATENET